MATNRNTDKLKTLIHYVAYRCIDEPHKLDQVKLNKALWFSDIAAYVERGQPITGEKYIKKPWGPVSSNLMWIVEELEKDGKLAVRQLKPDGGREYLALTTPDMSMFTGDEMRMISDAIEMVVHKHTSRSISRKSHGMAWELAGLDDEIPYSSVHAGRLHQIDKSDVDWAMKELQELGVA